jgi:hypothetical protein
MALLGVELDRRALGLAVVIGDIGACPFDPRPSSVRVPFDLKLPDSGRWLLYFFMVLVRYVLQVN